MSETMSKLPTLEEIREQQKYGLADRQKERQALEKGIVTEVNQSIIEAAYKGQNYFCYNTRDPEFVLKYLEGTIYKAEITSSIDCGVPVKIVRITLP